MLSMFVVVPLAICLLVMAVPAFSFAIFMLGLVLTSLPVALRNGPWALWSWLWQSFWIGGLMIMVAYGSFQLGSFVINGLIHRFTS